MRLSFLEFANSGTCIRVLIGSTEVSVFRDGKEVPGVWIKTQRALNELHDDLRKRIEVRAWPESKDTPCPWHARLLIGDEKAWDSSHSFDGVGKKTTYFTDKSRVVKELQHDFDAWWKGSNRVFPEKKS